jgi:glutamine synthetase
VQVLKYVIHNVAHAYNKTVTFMPKPMFGDNGSGMHCHQSLAKNGVNLFAGDLYGGLSEMALHYIGGIIKHAKAINAFANPTTNSYKRLVPGYEAPVMLAYSARNRSASIRIPVVPSPKARRIEVRFPDPAANPYLAFAAQLMAGLDGIINKIHPGDAMDKNLYDLPPEEAAEVPTVAGSLDEALSALDADREFLTRGGVFSDDFINSYLELKQHDVDRVRMTPHPLEFELYYSVPAERLLNTSTTPGKRKVAAARPSRVATSPSCKTPRWPKLRRALQAATPPPCPARRAAPSRKPATAIPAASSSQNLKKPKPNWRNSKKSSTMASPRNKA